MTSRTRSHQTVHSTTDDCYLTSVGGRMESSSDEMDILVPRRCDVTSSRSSSGNQMGSTNGECTTISRNNTDAVPIQSNNRGARAAPHSPRQASPSTSSVGGPALNNSRNKRRKTGIVDNNDHAPLRVGGKDGPPHTSSGQKARKNLLIEAAKISNEAPGVVHDRPLLQRFHSLITSARATDLIKVGPENSSRTTIALSAWIVRSAFFSVCQQPLLDRGVLPNDGFSRFCRHLAVVVTNNKCQQIGREDTAEPG